MLCPTSSVLLLADQAGGPNEIDALQCFFLQHQALSSRKNPKQQEGKK